MWLWLLIPLVTAAYDFTRADANQDELNDRNFGRTIRPRFQLEGSLPFQVSPGFQSEVPAYYGPQPIFSIQRPLFYGQVPDNDRPQPTFNNQRPSFYDEVLDYNRPQPTFNPQQSSFRPPYNVSNDGTNANPLESSSQKGEAPEASNIFPDRPLINNESPPSSLYVESTAPIQTPSGQDRQPSYSRPFPSSDNGEIELSPQSPHAVNNVGTIFDSQPPTSFNSHPSPPLVNVGSILNSKPSPGFIVEGPTFGIQSPPASVNGGPILNYQPGPSLTNEQFSMNFQSPPPLVSEGPMLNYQTGLALANEGFITNSQLPQTFTNEESTFNAQSAQPLTTVSNGGSIPNYQSPPDFVTGDFNMNSYPSLSFINGSYTPVQKPSATLSTDYSNFHSQPSFQNVLNSSNNQQSRLPAPFQSFNYKPPRETLIQLPTTHWGLDDTDFNSDSEECTCVPYYLCENGSIITDGSGLIDIRVKPGSCEDYMDVCCQKPLDAKKPIKPLPTKRQGCGSRHPDGIGFRITGAVDNEAQFGEFPWMMAIMKKSINDKEILEYQCGGALIQESVVLTAAHCVKAYSRKPKDLTIRAGEWDTQRTNEIYPHKDVKAVAIEVHPQFNSGSLWNDIALIFLEEPLPLGENIDTVCLPKGGQVLNHQECFASGWGKNNFGDDARYQVILKKVGLPIVQQDTCEQFLRTTRLGKYYTLHKSFICAGGIPGKDTCQGDGGSPLVCPVYDQPGIYEVTGIVSWGIGCGGEIPGIYANVGYARDWIDQTLAQFNVLI